ncbi:MAG TPA: TIGR04283 family arsenosugar biosynthesis glycosyltransferase [Balneolales bacterium]|nr:TIGR04283 family arsenosugar biosynthesis glycosyltransferase [Balneolales bacterium]
MSATSPTISIIIPAFNEEKTIGSLLHYLNNDTGHDSIKEVIVVDGQSTDQTVQIAREGGAKVITAKRKGRARQMNEGALLSSGDYLYFLHADTYPPRTFVSDIKKALQKGYKAGCYRLNFDSTHLLLRFYGWCTRFNIPAFRFGDQSLFIKREFFEEIGRFREDLIVMEDNEIIHRIREKAGFRIIPKSVMTSARKYKNNGFIRLQLIFTLIYVLYHFGIPQEQLVKLYNDFIH